MVFHHLICHRINTRLELENTPHKYGVEVDIRSNGSDLIIHHDPFKVGEKFEDWIKSYKNGTLILNVKEEGLEYSLMKSMSENDIVDFFFLDQSFPFLVKTALSGEPRCAIRISEFESIDTALSMTNKVNWIWVDCFNKYSLSQTNYVRLKDAGFKLCLVSPELHGRNSESEIMAMYTLLADQKMIMDAVCTKRPDLWEALND
jgi:hypothetical protein